MWLLSETRPFQLAMRLKVMFFSEKNVNWKEEDRRKSLPLGA